jgi:hypothetical protein
MSLTTSSIPPAPPGAADHTSNVLPVPPPPVAAPSPLVVDYKKLTWDDIDHNDEGGIVGVAGVVWANVKEKELRALCSALGLSKGIRGCKKNDMVQRITDAAYKRVQYEALRLEDDSDDDNENDNGDSAVEKTRREAQCPFRLLNILFCDKFANDFAATGNTANRTMLDSGKASNEQYLWEAAVCLEENLQQGT